MKKILITGGAGFIGSHLVRLLVKKYKNYHIFNLDSLTYSGNLLNLIDIESFKNYSFIKGDISDLDFIKKLFKKYNFDSIIHLAAESHVDRSIKDPMIFAKTNVMGTLNLLFCCKLIWKNNFKNNLFYHVSTDEVYGSLGDKGFFSENTPYDPRSPYSASKASSDHFVRSFFKTYNLPIIISNCSNNYGPHQFPEKLIPLFINNIINKKPLPVYGNGNNIRDWLYVEDHVDAIDLIFHKGKIGETYNIGGLNELKNIDLIKKIIKETDKLLDNINGSSDNLITYVKDRLGHDFRYAIDSTKLSNSLGWKPKNTFDDAIVKTIKWYLENSKWLKSITSGDYKKYYKEMYNLDN